MPEYRERIGRFIGASGVGDRDAPNTSAAASTIAAGLDWRSGDEVLLCDNEFPANAIPWVAIAAPRRQRPAARDRSRTTNARGPAARDFAAYARRRRLLGFVCGRLSSRFERPCATSRMRRMRSSASMRCKDLARFRSTSRQSVSTRFSPAAQSGCSACTAWRFSISATRLARTLRVSNAGLAFDARHVGFPQLRAAVLARRDAF